MIAVKDRGGYTTPWDPIPAEIAFVPPHPKPSSHSAPPPSTGEKRIAALITQQRGALNQDVERGERGLAAANERRAEVRQLFGNHPTSELHAQLAEANNAVSLAEAISDIALTKARALEDLLAGSVAELAQLAQLDSEQADATVEQARQVILNQAADAAALFADALVKLKKLASEVDCKRSLASGLAKRLGLSWSGGRAGFDDARVQLREILRSAWRERGFSTADLEHLVR